ncbi:phasin family protein [Bradyrhizobium liaoningense]|uniref:phasin family protein n=1 Tax=Bradyrhizobium liaoningense TaxID=43992 RepID=UPI001BA632AB|nr:phasin family protein [Bradyrhizobium liaoningense]MBR0719776.1 phasin family protein [Bradyrhizobium liaoningense]
MTQLANDRFEIPQELQSGMRSMAESGFRQAREAFEKWLSTAEAAAGSMEERSETMRAGARDIGAKAFGYAEANVQASLDHVEQLVHAKDVSEVMRLHSAYVQAQMRALSEQASEIGQAVSRAAIDATRVRH